MSGQSWTDPQVTSKTLWTNKNKGGGRIDVENPKPNQRKGQIHYQNGNDKYLYNPKENTFTDAPRSVNDLLKNKDVRKAIDKGLKYLGDDNYLY